MGETMEERFTAEDATKLLSELPDYEEALTLRTAGVTWMIWGIAVPGIFVSYEMPQQALIDAGLGWIFAVLWVPWIAAASWATEALWRTHAISLREEPEPAGKGWLISGGFTLLFLAMLAALYMAGPPIASEAYPVLVTGLFTVVLGLVNRFVWGYPGQVPVYVVGALIALAGLAIGLIATDVAVGALGALTVAVGYFALGAYHLAKG